MDLSFFIKGFIIGFTIAASIGPIGVLCVRRSLANGWWSGFFSGMGVATADGFYGAVAAFGLTFISSFLVAQQTLLRIIGAIFLMYLGVKIFVAKAKEGNGEKVKSKGLVNDFLSMLFLTITNPMTILLFTAVFANVGLNLASGSYVEASMLTLGVFSGSALIHAILIGILFGVFGKKLKPNIVVWVNRISGAVIIGFAVVTMVSLIKNFL